MANRVFTAGQNTNDIPDRLPPAFGAAWLLCFSIPWDDMIQLPGDIQLARVLSLVVAVIWLSSTLRGGWVRRPSAAFACMGMFMLWASVSVFWSSDPDRTVRRSLSYLQLFVMAWVIYQFSSTRSHYLRLLQGFVLGEFVLVVRVLMAFANGEIWGEGRYTAPGVNPNDLAGTLALGVPIASYLTAAGGRRLAWINALYVPAAIVCIVLNASRTGLLALGCALIFPLLLASSVSWKTRLAALMAALSGVALIGTFSETVSWRRLASIGEQVAARDLNGRMDVWGTAIDLFTEHPLVGIGSGTFITATGSMQALSIAGHNSFLEVLAENGAVGLALFLSILFALYRSRAPVGALDARMWLVMFGTWMLTNLANSWENKNITWLMWGLSLGYPLLRRAMAPAQWLETAFPVPLGTELERSLR